MLLPDLSAVEAQAGELFGAYQQTDMQFNVSRIEGAPQRGIDLIEAASGDRYYITQGSDALVEREINRRFGPNSILSSIDVSDDFNVYEVPDGARLLAKTLKQAPYGEQYMNGLAFRAGRFLRAIQKVDPELFGIRIINLAITTSSEEETGEADDIFFTVIPPLEKPDSNSSPADISADAYGYIRPNNTDAYLQGLEGRIRYAAR